MKNTISTIIIGLLFLSCIPFTHAQQVKGTVVDEEMAVMIGATVSWVETAIGTSTDEMGSFQLSTEGVSDMRLVVSFVGYQNDTIAVVDGTDYLIEMSPESELAEVVVEGKTPGSYITDGPAAMEVITDVELGKAACCDLAGCFNNNASVEPNSTNVITNARELRILGLSGVYNQVLLEGHPLVQGAAYTYGPSAIPGPFVKNIFIAKGATSVLQGVEGISGQINVIAQPTGEELPHLYANVFMNQFLENQYNFYTGQNIGNTKHFMGVHITQPGRRIDRNDDGFMDVPMLSRYAIWNKWQWRNMTDNGWFAKGGVRYTQERRLGGQMDYETTDKGSSNIYGQLIEYGQTDLWGRVQYRHNEHHATRLILTGQHHKQDAWYGETLYDAQQHLFDARLLHEFIYENGSNVRFGMSYKHLDLDEEISFTQNPLNKTYDGRYETLENTTGFFAENTYFTPDNKLTIVTGLRADHLRNWGWEYSPRILMKYSPWTQTDIRASAGYGWRVPKVFVEQSRVLSSQRDIHFHGLLEPERAWNYGLSWVQKFDKNNATGSFMADYFFTRFENHVQAHYHQAEDVIAFENNQLPATGHGIQIQADVEFWGWLGLKAAYNFLDIQLRDIETEQRRSMDFVTRHKLLGTLSISPVDKPWHFDFSAHWYGQKNLPNTTHFPEEWQQPSHSRPYTLLNTQFTYKWKNWEWYAGAENLLDFRMDNPIISAANPFDRNFDTAFAWGPVRGIESYVGLRWRWNRSE